MKFAAGNTASASSAGGNYEVSAGNGGSGGNLLFKSGDALDGQAGHVVLASGDAEQNGRPGSVTIQAGAAHGEGTDGGNIRLQAGEGKNLQGKGGIIDIQAGAGIVADSVAEAEYQECLNKAAAVIRSAEEAHKYINE